MQIADIRKEYVWSGLNDADMDADPIRQFEKWFQQAQGANLPEPNAMTLATAAADGQPSARVVLLKAFDAAGFAFFTNYDSRKGRELTANPRDAAAFLAGIAAARYASRARSSASPTRSRTLTSAAVRSAAASRWASPQSEVIPSRDVLEERVREQMQRFPDGEVPRPPHWGGFRVRPVSIEFWQGRPDRLHDRLRLSARAVGRLRLERLSP